MACSQKKRSSVTETGHCATRQLLLYKLPDPKPAIENDMPRTGKAIESPFASFFCFPSPVGSATFLLFSGITHTQYNLVPMFKSTFLPYSVYSFHPTVERKKSRYRGSDSGGMRCAHAPYAPSSSSPTRRVPSLPRPLAQKPSMEAELDMASWVKRSQKPKTGLARMSRTA